MTLQEYAMQMINQNPQVLQNNPRAQNMADVIKSGDNAAGEQLANNILQTMGITKEEAMRMAYQKFFGGGPR